jgi:hypothetical protein
VSSCSLVGEEVLNVDSRLLMFKTGISANRYISEYGSSPRRNGSYRDYSQSAACWAFSEMVIFIVSPIFFRLCELVRLV